MTISQRQFFAVLFALCCTLFFSVSSHASLFGGSANNSGPKPVEEAYQLSVEAIEGNRVLLRWDILDDYYLYDGRTSAGVTPPLALVEISRSPTKPKDDPLFGKVDVYYNAAEIVVQIEGEGLEAGTEVDVKVDYQGCWEGGVCYPPVTEVKRVALMGADANDSAAATSVTDLQAKASSQSVSEQDRFSALLGGGNLPLILAAFFVAGLALSLTPCVFPMIPILSSIIAGQGERITTRRSLFLSLVYVLAVSVTYTLAGVLAGMFGENLQVLFQTPWIIALFSGIFVLLAFSMFGFYELQLPSALQSKLSNVSNEQQGGSITGVAIMGLLSALIVGPCMAAPLAGALIYIGQTADPVLGGAALFSLSIGMGVPLLLIGASAGHILPKVGQWMDSVKAAFGVLLLAMAIYMLDRIVSIQVTMLLSALLLLASAVYMGALEALDKPASGWSKLRKSVALILLVYGASLLVGVLGGGKSFFTPLQSSAVQQGVAVKEKNSFNKVVSIAQLEPLLAQAQRENRPVMLDFYADWCISCVELEAMLEEPQVSAELKAFTLVKVDLTDYNQDAKALVEKYQVFGPPALVFYDRNGALKQDMTIIGLVDAKPFLSHIATLL
ncbi:MAG: protein-disulfide reductase DsbD [Pseudomonadales bacterium]